MVGTGTSSGRRMQAWGVLFCGLGLACGPQERDPRTVLPQDGDLLVSFPSVAQTQQEAGPFFDRVPEAAGLLEWLRSLCGMDLRSVERTREEGWDPDRPWGIAWRSGEWWAALPVDREAKVRRRLGLRLARLGMVSREALGGGVRYQDLRNPRRRAWVAVEGGVARVCLSEEDRCQTPSPPGQASDVPARIGGVARETGIQKPALVFRLSGEARKRLLPEAWRARWPRGLAGEVAWAAIGEIRGAVQWVPAPVIRVLVGASGAEVEPLGSMPPLQSGEVAALGLDLGRWMPAIRGPIQDLGLDPQVAEVLRRWDGRLRVAVQEGRRATGPGPLSWRDRFPLGARLGMLPESSVAREGGDAATEASVISDPSSTQDPIRFRLPVLGEVRGVLGAGEIRWMAGVSDPEDLGTGPLALEDGLVAWIRVDWQRVVRGLGGDSLGLPAHLAAVIGEVQGRVLHRDGRVLIEASLVGPQAGGR